MNTHLADGGAIGSALVSPLLTALRELLLTPSRSCSDAGKRLAFRLGAVIDGLTAVFSLVHAAAMVLAPFLFLFHSNPVGRLIHRVGEVVGFGRIVVC